MRSTFDAQEAPRLHGLPPLVNEHTRMLVLGSFSSAASLARQQYYAHPKNAFWRLLQALWPMSPMPCADAYPQPTDWLLDKGLGLWGVYAFRREKLHDCCRCIRQCVKSRKIFH